MTACEILAYASRFGLTVADFKNLSIGFVLDFIETQFKINKGVNLHSEEIRYYRMKKIRSSIERKYLNKEITEKDYLNWVAKFSVLEARYGE